MKKKSIEIFVLIQQFNSNKPVKIQHKPQKRKKKYDKDYNQFYFCLKCYNMNTNKHIMNQTL